MRQLFRVLLLSVALLLAQHGALAHELAHAVGQVSTDGDTDHRDDAAPCAGCVAFAQVAASVLHADVQLVLDERLTFVAPDAIRHAGGTPDVLQPRSRDPPLHF